jgi:uncharacterized membrane protein YheB (UPF0754 family)
MELRILFIPVVGFFIGYLTNYLAVKMLFYPRKRILGYQGVIPRRKREIAKKISEESIKIMPDYLRNIKKIPVIGEKFLSYFKKSIEVQINNLSDEELESIVLQIARREFRIISFIGGVLGFIIGLFQILIFYCL